MSHCAAPGCDTNRKFHGKRSLFGFPKHNSDLRQKWLSHLHRQDFEPSRTSKLCEIHFEDRFLVRTISAVRDDGQTVQASLARPHLTKDAFPTLFPANFPVANKKGKLIQNPSYLTMMILVLKNAFVMTVNQVTRNEN